MTVPDTPAEPPRPHRPAPVRAADLSIPGARWEGPTDVRVTGICLDSRSVQPGDLYCALPGARAHGADFTAQAVQRGAAAALTDAAGAPRAAAAGLPVLLADDARAAVAPAAVQVYGAPAEHLRMIAVTGTNGKTSVTTMLHRTLEHLGRSSGLIGTSGTFYTGQDGAAHRIATVRTTPEATDVQGILARMHEDGVASCAMEVSSHAMVLHRADGIVFDVACFTNLSQDHLDFHRDMEEYFAAKASLFTPEHARRAVVCVDDAWGRRLAAATSLPVLTYSTSPDADADLTVVAARPARIGTDIRVRRRDGRELTAHAPVPGRAYVANTIAVIALLEAIGVAGPEVISAIAEAATVPGRMEPVATAPIRGIVDYSHTEDAITQALTTLRELPGTGRLIAVIGAGGDRDATKRPRMGAAAARGADLVVITDDNPRTEDPAAIRRAVLAGVPDEDQHRVVDVAGRAEAIRRAVALSRPGDTILVAGKGAETGQDIGGTLHPFDDRVQLRAALEARARKAQEEETGC